MSEIQAYDHDWALPRLTAYSVGMLSEEQTLRLEQHLLTCDDCRARLVPQQRATADAGHLPASLIATWPRASRLLSGLERGLVESHLRSCEACRATLAFAGHEPVLAAAEHSAPPARAALPSARRFAWGWALGLSGVAAAAAAWLFVVRPALFPHDSRTSATMSPLSPQGSESGGFQLALPPATAGAIELPETSPGSAPLPMDALLSAAGELVLRVPAGARPASAADGARGMTLTALRAGREFASATGHWSELGECVRLHSETRLAVGDYEVRISVAPASESSSSQAWSWLLRVR